MRYAAGGLLLVVLLTGLFRVYMTRGNHLWMSWEVLSQLIRPGSSRLNLSALKSKSDTALSYISVNNRMAVDGHRQTSVEDRLALSPRTFTAPVFELFGAMYQRNQSSSDGQFV